jgi:Ribonuclease G/E
MFIALGKIQDLHQEKKEIKRKKIKNILLQDQEVFLQKKKEKLDQK